MENLSDRLNSIPEIEFLEDRFQFIENEVLRTNLSISFQYVIFLITMEEEITLQGPISYSIFKNIILNTAAIVEGSLHHLVGELIKRDELNPDKLFPKEEIYSNRKVLYKVSDDTEICGIHFKRKSAKLKASTGFSDLNRACKRAKLFNEQLFLEVEELREKRNKIHLAGLKEVDNYYQKEDIQKALETVSKILRLVERNLGMG